MSDQNDLRQAPTDPKRDPAMLQIMRWLAEDSSRTLPLPDDDDGIQELAQALRRDPERIRKLMMWNYGDQDGSDTLRILT
jgi:hypothetical protein